jgi:hypothetical protein
VKRDLEMDLFRSKKRPTNYLFCRIYQAGVRNKSAFQCEVALTCMVQPLFFSGEFEDLFLCFDRILKSYEKHAKAGTEQPVVNAVIDTVVALAYWPLFSRVLYTVEFSIVIY